MFDTYAAKYDAWYDTEPGKTIFAMEMACLRPFIENRQPWLEVGVGSGRFAQALGIDYGLDPSMSLLQLAKSRGIRVVRGVGEELPFKSGQFVGVLMVLTLCFVTDPEKVLREAGQVVKREGWLVLGLILRESPWAEFYQRRGREAHPLYQEARFYSRRQVEAMLKRAGLGELEYRSVLRQPPGLASYRPEMPVAGYVPDAGFAAVRSCRK